MKYNLKSFTERAKSKGFTAKKITETLYEFHKEGWQTFQVEGVKGFGYGFIIPNPSPKDGQPISDFVKILETYIEGRLIIPGKDESDMGEILQEIHESGCEIVEVGKRDYYIKDPKLLAMSHIWEDAETGDLKVEILNQLA